MKVKSSLLSFILITVHLILCNSTAYSRVSRFIYPNSGTLRVDGVLDEACYKASPPITKFNVAGEPEKICQSTRCWTFWDSHNLYFAFECEDSWIYAPDRVMNEAQIGSHDRVEVFLWSGNEKDSYISLELGAQGLAFDYATRFYRQYDPSLALANSVYKVTREGNKYCAEIRISAEDLKPFGILISEGKEFCAGLFRADYYPDTGDNDPVWITWVDSQAPAPDFHIPASFGTFILKEKREIPPELGSFDHWRLGDNNVLLYSCASIDSLSVETGGWRNGIACEWIGEIDEDNYALLNTSSGFLLLKEDDAVRVFKKPESRRIFCDTAAWYGGLTATAVLESGTDILGRQILEKEKINPEEIVGLLPPITNGYQLLGSPLSGPPPRIMKSGVIYGGLKEDNAILFDPGEEDPALKDAAPVTGLIDEWIPIAHYTYPRVDTEFSLIAFVAWWDRGIAPIVWIRLAEIARDGTPVRERYWSATSPHSEAVTFGRGRLKEETAQPFWKEFAYTLHKWEGLGSVLSLPDIPDKSILANVKGSIALTHVVFSGDQPRYGAGEYGRTVHMTFPPTFLTTLETAYAYGERERAEHLMDFWLKYSINDDGTFSYFMGRLMPAASATEYGMLFRLLERIDRAYRGEWGIDRYFDKLTAAAWYLSSLRRPAEGLDARLIHLGAEADNEKLKYAYFSNNLWAARGLKSLSVLLERYGRTGTAQHIREISLDLEKDVMKALAHCAIKTEFGMIPPIHTEYAPLPLTLSSGLKKPSGTGDEAWTAYNAGKDIIEPVGNLDGKPQNLRENTYANYRYYLEMLSSGTLPDEMADAIAALRKERGGLLLGMTRFSGHLDDWPVAEWAAFLLSRDMMKEYWLLLYAHMYHHMDRSTHTAYEQVGIDGRIRADACLPAQLVVPRMLAWAFAFESPEDETLCLLRGVPQEWYAPGSRFGWKNLATPAGLMDIEVISKEEEIGISLQFESAFSTVPIALQINCTEEIEIAEGGECVDRIEQRKMILKAPYSGLVRLVLKR